MPVAPHVRSKTGRILVCWLWLVTVGTFGPSAAAQTSINSASSQSSDQHPMAGMGNDGLTGMATSQEESYFMNESSGTAVEPSAWPMPMVMTGVGDWNLMWMAQTFLVDT